jgi:hypothetical protein
MTERGWDGMGWVNDRERGWDGMINDRERVGCDGSMRERERGRWTDRERWMDR